MFPSGSQSQWGYDFIGRLLSEQTTTTAGASVATFYQWGTSNAAGDPSTAKAYLSKVTLSGGGQSSRVYDLSHSPLGQLQAVQETSPGSTDGAQTSYNYDLRGRLTSESRTRTVNGQTYSGSASYSYDAADNLNGGTNGWVYDVDNKLTSAPAAGGLPGASGLSYDTAGNLTGINGKSLAYNAQGQVSTISGVPSSTGSGTTSISITYDPLGRRWSRTDTGTGETTYYDYDGGTLIGQAVGSVYTAFNWGANGLVSDSTGGAERYYQYNPQGDTALLRDAAAGILWLQLYGGDAFGNRQEGPVNASAAPSPFGWGGQGGNYSDYQSGFVYNGSGGMSGGYASATGAAADGLSEEEDFGSAGAFYAKSAKLGWGQLTGMPAWQPGSAERQNMSNMFQALTGPVGLLYGGYTVLTGKDPIAGRCLTIGERVWSGILLAATVRGKASARVAGGTRATARRKPVIFERYGSETEALASKDAKGLVPKPVPHQNNPKWIGESGTVDHRTLGDPKNYTHKMTFEADPDALDWAKLNSAELKANEPGRYAIPADKLEEFNEMIRTVTIEAIRRQRRQHR